MGQKQRVVFVDPKGIRNLQSLYHPKIQLFKTLKEEVEPTLNDPDISLDSYIISNTAYNEVHLWGERPKFLENHILFDYDEEYVKTMFGWVMTESRVDIVTAAGGIHGPAKITVPKRLITSTLQ